MIITILQTRKLHSRLNGMHSKGARLLWVLMKDGTAYFHLLYAQPSHNHLVSRHHLLLVRYPAAYSVCTLLTRITPLVSILMITYIVSVALGEIFEVSPQSIRRDLERAKHSHNIRSTACSTTERPGSRWMFQMSPGKVRLAMIDRS